MQPSPAERFYLEQLQRDQEAAAMQVAAAAAAASSAQIASSASGFAAHAHRGASQAMKYEQCEHVIPQVVTENDWPFIFEIPGEYGTALALFVTVSTTTSSWPDSYLWWWLSTTMDGDYWHSLAPPGGSAARVVRSSSTTGIRVHGPFGNRIGLQFLCRQSNRDNDYGNLAAQWDDVTVQVAAQRV